MLKIEANPDAYLSLSQGARRDEERIKKRLPLRGRGGRSEVAEGDELCAEAEDGLVEYVVNFDDGAQAQLFAQAETRA